MTRKAGFTLIELAMVLFVLGLLLGTLMYTLSAQSEQRARTETQRTLEEAKELLLSFAVVNGRLPCPGKCTTAQCDGAGDGGDEAGAAGACTDSYAGYLPGRAIGFSPTDSSGYVLDAWGNRIRYAVADLSSGPAADHFTNATNLKSNGITTTPSDLVVCQSASGIVTSPLGSVACNNLGTTANGVTNRNIVAAVVWSHGKNYAYLSAYGADETVNNKRRLPSALNNHGVFVWHEPRPEGAGGGEYDDQLVWIPVGMLYGRMIAAGVLP